MSDFTPNDSVARILADRDYALSIGMPEDAALLEKAASLLDACQSRKQAQEDVVDDCCRSTGASTSATSINIDKVCPMGHKSAKVSGIPDSPGAWTLDSTVDVTPVGRYVSALRKSDRRLEELEHPGFRSHDNRVKRLALQAMTDANRLRGEIRDELARFDALPVLDDEETEAIESSDLWPATPQDIPRFCAEDAEASNFREWNR